MPFAALQGYDEVLRSREKVYVSEPELSDDMKEEIDRTLKSVTCGSLVEIVVYDDGVFEKVSGMVSKILPDLKQIMIVKRAVPMEHIYRIKVLRKC